jgi:hypothetical protein
MREEFDTDGLCPGDVTFSVFELPVWEETPCSPPFADDDADADTRASI